MAEVSNISELDFTQLDKIKKDKNPGASETAQRTLGQNFDDFLRLLTTQLQNQDPTEPLDTNQFTQQLATLSQVEQQIATNKNLEQLIANSTAGQINDAVSYIGKTIDAKGSNGVLDSGRGEFSYTLPFAATKTTVSILNSSNEVVFSGEGSKKAGKNVVIWDGINSFNGRTEPNGMYKIVVNAKDATDKDIEATTYTTGRVTSVDLEEGEITLSVGTLKIPMDEVISVRETPENI